MTTIDLDLSQQGTEPSSSAPTFQPSRRAVWVGRTLSTLAVLFLLFDGVSKVLRIRPVIDGSAQLGYPASTVLPIGVLVLVGVALYVFPRTAVLGAVYLTGFLGGAVATHLRVGNPLVSHTLSPTYFAAVLWLGLWLRDRRVRAVLPLR